MERDCTMRWKWIHFETTIGIRAIHSWDSFRLAKTSSRAHSQNTFLLYRARYGRNQLGADYRLQWKNHWELPLWSRSTTAWYYLRDDQQYQSSLSYQKCQKVKIKTEEFSAINIRIVFSEKSSIKWYDEIRKTNFGSFLEAGKTPSASILFESSKEETLMK